MKRGVSARSFQAISFEKMHRPKHAVDIVAKHSRACGKVGGLERTLLRCVDPTLDTPKVPQRVTIRQSDWKKGEVP